MGTKPAGSSGEIAVRGEGVGQILGDKEGEIAVGQGG